MRFYYGVLTDNISVLI